ncbi:uncharacterized protein METZ01_LOCUS363091 [marine metagenome]|uniref:Uncharacterized protein n=1 Tax=marine metagenome TaxID=408172 RepID=A0A382SM09_9ZZZZ
MNPVGFHKCPFAPWVNVVCDCCVLWRWGSNKSCVGIRLAQPFNPRFACSEALVADVVTVVPWFSLEGESNDCCGGFWGIDPVPPNIDHVSTGLAPAGSHIELQNGAHQISDTGRVFPWTEDSR